MRVLQYKDNIIALLDTNYPTLPPAKPSILSEICLQKKRAPRRR